MGNLGWPLLLASASAYQPLIKRLFAALFLVQTQVLFNVLQCVKRAICLFCARCPVLFYNLCF